MRRSKQNKFPRVETCLLARNTIGRNNTNIYPVILLWMRAPGLGRNIPAVHTYMFAPVIPAGVASLLPHTCLGDEISPSFEGCAAFGGIKEGSCDGDRDVNVRLTLHVSRLLLYMCQ